MITVTVDTGSPVPPFEQVRAQLAEAIRTGALDPGTRLPTVRQLAGDLGLAPNTVARAYRSLDDDGLVDADGRRGTRVADGPTPSEADLHRLFTAAAQRYLAEVRRLGGTLSDAHERLDTVADHPPPST
jgi:DNA-binding transcriptional regulator YhcF (GntR family)